MNFYCIAQYAPDPVKDERINFGVFVAGEGQVDTYFLSNWIRVKQFGGEAVDFLKDFARSCREIDEDGLRRIAGHWRNSIQISEPRASLMPKHDLLLLTARKYLVDPPSPPEVDRYRCKTEAVNLVTRHLRRALRERMGGPGALLIRKQFSVNGTRYPHTFDVTVANGNPYFAAQAISFEGPADRKLEKQVSATAFAIEDVKSSNRDFPLSVFALPPATHTTLYESAVATFRDLGAEVVGEQQLSNWATEMVHHVRIDPVGN